MAIEAPDLKVTIEKAAAWTRRLTITVPAASIQRERREAVARLARQARLPGFRKGKVPAQIMEKRYGPAIDQDTLEKVIGAAYHEAIRREGLEPISQGNIDNIDYQPGADLTFHVQLEVKPEIELGRIGGFRVSRPTTPVADTQVDEVLDRLREEHAVWRAKDGGTPTAGDLADVEITPLDEATGAPSAEPRRYQIQIGSGQAVAAVEDAIRTVPAGAEAEFTLDLPGDAADAESATKPHRLRLRLVEVKAPEYPVLDDEFARAAGEFESLDALRTRVREDLEREAEQEAERSVRGQLVQQIVEANAFELPATMVQRYLERVMPTPEDGADDRIEGMRSQMWPAAEQALRRMLVIERVAELESLQATAAEVEARIDGIAERLGRPHDEIHAQLQKGGRLDGLEQEITEDKVFEYLKSLSSIQ